MDLLRSLPLGLYLEQPVTWLHHLDSRVKFIWLMSFLAVPLLANPYCRLAVVVLLILLTLSAAIPLRVWRQQMGWLLMLSVFVFILTAIAPDGLAVDHQPRLPEADIIVAESAETSVQASSQPRPWYNPFGIGRELAPEASLSETVILTNLPQPTDYSYILLEAGPVTITRRSLDLAVRVSTVIFTLIYSTNLYLLTTAPEEITAGLESLMLPLRRLNIPVTEIALTLTLSLRFIPLVLEEVQNLVRSIRTRAINWKKLGVRRSAQVWIMVTERLLENLLMRADQIAKAMTVRGFTSPNQHRVQWHQLRLHWGDWIAIASLAPFWVARLIWGGMG
ncbi:energy-coupling factor transporter transmembrane component T family protein [Coleofasciculus sp. G2-EDA-02]|uniref:energy-coupling factor transporter transmembrane component T family protein n=1 Tax=Coleofasciculus sp. G2-EDA-02 TaxID=3069529 RepID=UPI0033001A3F